jgi:hypothetical protein
MPKKEESNEKITTAAIIEKEPSNLMKPPTISIQTPENREKNSINM